VEQNAHISQPVAAVTPLERPRRRSETPREVVAVAPLRVDLTGGFTDIPPFSMLIESVHINAAIDRSVTVRCRARPDRQIDIRFAGEAGDLSMQAAGRRRFAAAVQAGVAEFAARQGFDLSIESDAPAGSGLGSSGAILVAAISGCAKLAGVEIESQSIAERAICAARAIGIIGGRQDEFAAAYGSLRAYLFHPNGTARTLDLTSSDACRHLEEALFVVQMTAAGRSSDIVADVVANVRAGRRDTIETLHRLQALSEDLLKLFQAGQINELARNMRCIREAQEALHQQLCCPLAAAAMNAIRRDLGELEYKALGGGGSGACLLVHVPSERKSRALSLLRRHAVRVFEVKVRARGAFAEFETRGADTCADDR